MLSFHFIPENGIEPSLKDFQSSTLPLSYSGLNYLQRIRVLTDNFFEALNRLK